MALVDPDASAAAAYDQGKRDGAVAWQPIDTAPTDRTNVIVCTPEGVVGEAKYYDDDKGWWWAGFDPSDSYDGQCFPSLWQPLPEPPDTPTP